MFGSRKADDPLLSQRHWIHEAQSGLRLAGPGSAALVSVSHPDSGIADGAVVWATAVARATGSGPVAQVVRAHP